MSQLRARGAGTKVFLVSGVTDDVRRDLARKISQLGGKYFDLQIFKAICTHVICGKLSKSEKFLGGCACGKWVLHPDYVHQSVAAGAWLDEEQFEWCDEHILRRSAGVVPELYFASRRWRFMLGEEGRGAFCGWKVAVIAGAKKSQVIKRLLISGGAEVMNLRLPVKNADKVANMLGYIFVSEHHVDMVGHLFDYGVLCIRPEFIADYLLLDPQPDPMEYLVQNGQNGPVPDPHELPASQGSDMTQSSQDSFLKDSQTGRLDITNSPATSTHTGSTSFVGVPAGSLDVLLDVGMVKVEPALSRRRPTRAATGGRATHTSVATPTRAATRSQATPTSQLFPRAGDRHQQEDVIEIDITPQDTGGGRATATSTAAHLDGLVIDLLSDVDTPDTRDTRLPDTPLSGLATPLTGLATSLSGETGGRRRASRSCTAHSPAWKQLIPRSRPKPAETPTCQDTDMLQSSPIDNNVTKAIATPKTNKARSSMSAASSPLSSSQHRNNGVANNSEKQNGKMSQERVTSTPAKSGGSSKSLRNGPPTCMSPITFYFKPKVNNITETGDAATKTTADTEAATVTMPPARPSRSRRTSTASSGATGAPLSPVVGPGGDSVGTDPTPPHTADLTSSHTADLTSSHTADLTSSHTADLTLSHVGNMEVDSEPVKPPVTADTALTPLTPAGAAGCSRKRKSGDDPSLHLNLQEQKRQKISFSEWRPTKFSLILQDEMGEQRAMRCATADIILTTFEEEDEFTMIALQELNSRVGRVYFPPAEILARLIHTVLPGAKTETEAHLCHAVLMKVVRLHPPVTMEIQQVYLQALAGGREERGVAEEWHTLHTCCRMILNEESAEVRRNYVLLLSFLRELLQLNLQHFMLTGAVKAGWRHMLLRVLWSPSYHVVFNNRCRELLDLMTDTISRYQAQTSEDDRTGLLSVLQSVVWLVAMAAECCRLEEGSQVVRGVRALQRDKVAAFVHEITRRIIDVGLQEAVVLQCVLTSLQLPWLCVGVCQQLLNTLDDYLLPDDAHRDTAALTLTAIVSRYFFLLPRMCSKPESNEKASSALRQRQERVSCESLEGKLGGGEGNNGRHVNNQVNGQVNKKNAKGETQLHRACITGNTAKLKQLLHVPGIDVNAKDNFGWSPLHEACNHGNVECVRELLKFVPSKSLVQYFNKGHRVSKVDLFACNSEGITPLHDAVLNERLEVCRLLLQHAGARLLTPVTTLGYTPLDLATSEEMRALLAAFVPLKRRVSLDDSVLDSQDSCSSMDEMRTELPSEGLYTEVLEVDGRRVFADTQALVSYMQLTTTLVYSYVTAGRLDNMKHRTTKRSKSHTEQNSVCEQDRAQCVISPSICDTNNRFQRTQCEKENIPSAARRRESHGNSDSVNPPSRTRVPGTQPQPTHLVNHLSAKDRPESPRTLAGSRDHRSSQGVPRSPLRLAECVGHQFSSQPGTRAGGWSPLPPTDCVEHLDREERSTLRRDVRVARRLAQYRDMFQQHLYKLCRHGDRKLVDSGLLELNDLVELLQQQG